MSAKEQRRQKKLAKKRSKEIAQKKDAAREKNVMQSLKGQLQSSLHRDIERCLISESLFDESTKFGTVLISRPMKDGREFMVRFLIDGMCLGVKDIHAAATFPSEVTSMIERLGEAEPLQTASAATARKLVESVISFSKELGLSPHSLYAKVDAIWTGVDADDCLTEFEFGKDGKPLYIAGPHDTPDTISHIASKLEASHGIGNYEIDYGEAEGLSEIDELLASTSDAELDVDIDEDVVDEPRAI